MTMRPGDRPDRPAVELRTQADLAALMGVPFSSQQLEAITAPLEPGVIVAGAGSGKTTVMAARVVWLVGTGTVAADEILGLTFTNKAAAELGQRVRKALGETGLLRRVVSSPDARDEGAEPEIAEPTVLTYHAYAARLLTEHGLRIGHEPDTTVVADASRFQLAARVLREHTQPIDHLNTWLPTSVTALLQLDAQLSEHLVTTDDVRQFQADEIDQWRGVAKPVEATRKLVVAMQKRAELLALVDDYQALKRRLGVMDFSDQMALGAQLAEHRREVGRAEREKYKIVLLDEYQDTSVAQARLLTALFSGPVDDGRGHPVTAVGDPCQAIYGWRGASVSNIERFGHDFPLAPATTDVVRFPLSVNRRSDARILTVANQLAEPLYADHAASLPLEPAGAATSGVVRAASLSTYADELDFLAVEVPRAHAAMPVPLWSNIGVLVRDNKTANDVHDALTAAGVPVEVVGLNGLLRMPEVAAVVATLEVIHDVTANAALLTLLTAPRWAIGPRDLALLGRRARQLAQGHHIDVDDIAGKLEEAVAGVDPADIVSLVEALDEPGNAPYSAQARERFRQLSRELRMLRRHVGEPLLDLVRRVIDVTGLDVELASSTSPVAAARRDNVSTFLDAVSSFAGIDGDASLPGLLAYLAAEEEYGQGLSLAVPSEANSVKLLTVHRAKGLEWDVVFVPGVCTKVFPSGQGRSRWPSAPAELPWPLRGDYVDLPKVREVSGKGITAFVEDCKAHELQEERRLAYVAVTRPRRELVVSCHWWGPEQKVRRGPSLFFDEIVAAMETWGAAPELVAPVPDDDAVNPSNRADQRFSWPVEAGDDEVDRREAAAALVAAAGQQGVDAAMSEADNQLMLDEIGRVQQWDVELERLVAEARAGRADEIVVTLPSALSATTMLRLQDDPQKLARDLARPMPRRPSASARFGTRFHAWVEQHVGRQQELLEPDDLPGRGDVDIEGNDELRELVEAFAAGPFGTRTPYRIEAPFALVLASQVVRGRIDAVYETPTGFLVVDWKTNRKQDADPLQLAIYRLAWSELMQVSLDQVQTAFYYVRSGDVVEHADLPDRAALERLVAAPGSGA